MNASVSRRLVFTAATSVAALACAGSTTQSQREPTPQSRHIVPSEPGERHLANIRQLTFGGENAEAYWSADGTHIIFQSTRDGRGCDQEYVMRADGSDVHRVSTGGGKTTCGYFFAYDRKIFFASTHAADTACPRKPDPSRGYVWGLDPYDIYTANPDGSDLKRLTSYGVYTAEGVLAPNGKRIAFTSLKDGDLDIYTMNIDGTDVKQLTSTPGYDGGPWWSPDGTQIVYRSNHPTDSSGLAEYRALLAQRLVRPSRVELFLMSADGTNQHQITHLGGANFGPSWYPDGKHIIFSSNFRVPHSGNFDLFLVRPDGSELEQLTTHEGFDGFPMFSPDGKHLLWASGRATKGEHELNLFVADWIP